MSDYTIADTIYALFTTRSFSTGAPTQLAGSPVVSAYENESVTQITAGVTLGVDHDTVTGLNLVTVVASGANGFEAGKDYHLVITTGTVGGVSVVGEVVFRFTLSRSAAAVDLANGTDGLGAIKTDTAAILTDTADMQPKLGTPAGASISADILVIDNFVDGLETTIGAAGAGLTAVASQVWDLDATGHQTGGTFGQAIGDPVADANTIYGAVVTGAAGATVAADIIAMKVDTAAILVDTNELQTDWVNGGRLDLILDARSSQISVDDLPTNAELATALGTADDAVLAAVAALNNFDPATEEVLANIQKINDVVIVGDGSVTPFNV